MKIAIKELLSPVHDAAFIANTLKIFEADLWDECQKRGLELTYDLAESDMSIYYVKSGGVENYFVDQFDPDQDFYVLLTSDQHNSLPAALELHAYITQQGCQAEILHGQPSEIAQRLATFTRVITAKKELQGLRLGVIGQPSDWLIASNVDYERVKRNFGIEVMDIDLKVLYQLIDHYQGIELPDAYAKIPVLKHYDQAKVSEAAAVYLALKEICKQYDLQAFTLRCFDVVMSGLGTGCLALSLLNAEGIIAGCEGDIPAALSMIILNKLSGQPIFMANPSRLDRLTHEVVFAHCTVPWNMCETLALDTHFETGQGIGVKGNLALARATVFRISSNLEHFYADEGQILQNGQERSLCRTQITMRLDDEIDYFTKAPLGNHHLICLGEHLQIIEDFFELVYRY